MAPTRRRKRLSGTDTSTIAMTVNKAKSRAPTIAATTRNVVVDRNSYPYSAIPSPTMHPASKAESGSDSSSDAYPDPDTDVESRDDAGRDSKPDVEQDAEAEEILRSIAQFRKEGPAKPKHTSQTVRLWKRESEFWKEYCHKIRVSPEDQVRECDPAVFKGYMSWRKKNFRIKKESSMKSYWKRISMYYHNVTGYAMGNDVLDDTCNWLPSLELDKSSKEKRAMFVQDLYPILHALWIDDTKPLHGFIRVQISLLLLLSAATATRPGALVESASNKGSNKALCFKDVEIMKVRSVEDRTRSIIVANVNLVHIKNKEKDGKPKKFTFRLEGLPAFCIVSHMLGIGGGRKAFKNDYSNFQEIFDLVIPEERNLLRIKWKEKLIDKPFFCNVIGGKIEKEKAFPYSKYRDIFMRLGRVAGFEAPLELYQLRRASGKNIDSALTSTERNQTMGHSGATYEKFYTPTHIPHDFQSIYFGTPSEEELIRSVASLGLSRDRRAPTELKDDQQKEVRDDPMLVALREERDTYKTRLYSQGFRPLSKAKGTRLHDKYEEVNKKISSTYQKLQRVKLDTAIHEFHNSVDTDEIDRQLSGKRAAEVLTLPAVEFEFRERATIASMLFESFKDEEDRIRFIGTLSKLCHRKEMRRHKALKRKEIEFVEYESSSGPSSRTRKKVLREFESSLRSQTSKLEEPDTPRGRDIVEVQARRRFPMVAPHRICSFCADNKQLAFGEQTKYWRKDVLKKHQDRYFREARYQGWFTCPYPNCEDMVFGRMHFNRHSLDVHNIEH